MARWYLGDPEPALEACTDIADDAEWSTVNAVSSGAFAAMILASSGRLADASAQLESIERAACGGDMVALMGGYVVGITALVAAAHGDDETAGACVERGLAEHPPTTPVGWQLVSRWLTIAYVLAPAARPTLDDRAAGFHLRRLAVAHAVAAAREGMTIDPTTAGALTPGLVATAVPLPWAMVLAGRLDSDGFAQGHEIAEWLIRRFGQPAREALRDAGSHHDRRVAAGARSLLATITVAPHQLKLAVLGPASLRMDGVERRSLDWQRERVRSLMLFLVVNGPARRDQIIDALWPDLDADAADRNLRVTLSYLHRALEPDRKKGEAPFFVRQTATVLRLADAPHLVVDAYEFEALVERAAHADRSGTPSVALTLLEEGMAMWGGRCLADVEYEEWAQPARQRLTDRFVRAAVRAAELSLAAGRLDRAQAHARRALATDEWSEPAHRVLIAAALATGDHLGAARALAACERMLADLGVAPAPETSMLRRRLRHPVLEATA